VKLCVAVTVSVAISEEDGISESFDTTTIDISPHGASVRLGVPLPLDSTVRLSAQRYSFETLATVRSITRDRETGAYCVGLEHLDDVNPIVVWKESGKRAMLETSS
jgi:hypothetical protein